MALYFLLLFIALFFSDFSTSLLDQSQGMHDLCLSFVDGTDPEGLQRAFICGANLSSKNAYEVFRTTGLLHLIVVSGSHLSFLQQALTPLVKGLPQYKWGLLIVFLGYSSCCLWDPPITRAAVFWGVQIVNSELKLGFSGLKRVHLSGLLCLLVFPEWILSYSLQLSWLASLAIVCQKKILAQSAACYFALSPILIQFSTIHPLTIAVNTILSPVFGFALLPLTLLANTIPGLATFGQSLWAFCLEALSLLANEMPSPYKNSGAKASAIFLWTYLFFFQAGLRMFFHFKGVKKTL